MRLRGEPLRRFVSVPQVGVRHVAVPRCQSDAKQCCRAASTTQHANSRWFPASKWGLPAIPTPQAIPTASAVHYTRPNSWPRSSLCR